MALRAPRIWEVIEEHLDDAAFHWELWESALASPVRTPREIAANLEPRLRANVEGLCMACPEAIERLLVPALYSGMRGRIAAAALVLAQQPRGLDHCLHAIRKSAIGVDEPIARALALTSAPELNAGLVAALAKRDARVVATALNALALRRVDPGPPLLEWLKTNDPLPRAAALRAAAFSAQPVRSAVEIHCASPRSTVRDAAIATALRLGLRVAYTSCERQLDTEADAPAYLYEVLAMGGDPAALPRLMAGLEKPATRADALVALGRAGWVRALDPILECADEPKLARLAGEAFAAITGAEIEGPFLREEAPLQDPPAFEDEDLDAPLLVGPEAELPVPEPVALRSWWGTNSSRFDPTLRYLDGAPWTPQRLHAAFLNSAMRRRQALGFELAVRTRLRWEVDGRAWATAQLAAEQRPLQVDAEAKQPFTRVLRE